MFLSENFNLNGVSNSSMNVYMCDFDSSVLNEIGFEFSRGLTKEENFVNNPMYKEESSGDNEIELNLLLYDMQNKQKLTWTNEVIEKIYNWLITDDFVEFYSEDNINVVYFLKATSIRKVFTPSRKGYLRVTFKSIDEHCYIKKEFNSTVNGSGTLAIPNPSRKAYKPIIEITNNGNASTINKINDMEVKNLANGEKIIIDNLTCTVLDKIGNNMFSHINRKWVSLLKGNNTLSLSGNMTIKILCQFPMIL